MSISESGQYDLLDQLAEEFAARIRRGERPALKEYTDRYPDLADDIRDLFPALVKVEQADGVRRGEDEPTGDTRTANPPPRQIGDYRILRQIGRGGMGVVYEAEQISLGRRVALKVLPGQVSNDRVIQERFRREARAAARLHHTNIVPVYEVGQDGDVRFYAMQFIQGLGLDAVIHELRQLLDRARSHSRFKAASGGRSPRPRGAHSHQGIDTPTLPEGVEVNVVLQFILTGRFDPSGQGPEPPGAPPPIPARSVAGGLPTPTAVGRESRAVGSDPTLTSTEAGSATAGDATGPQRAHPPAPALSPSAPSSSGSAVLPGGTQLSSVESGRRRFFRSLAQIGRQVAGGLAHAHARGIVHRDIKPSNLLLDTEGVVWIADFGLAKGEDEGLTQSGDILGTIRYMAPERFRGEGDARADVYALGLTLYELLTLRSGFDSADRLKLIEQIKTEEPRKPRSVDARIPRDLETIVLKAIEKDPRARYQSAEAMGDDLGRFLADEPIRARQVSAAERYLRWARRNPVIATLGGVLTAVLVAATVISMAAAAHYKDSARRETSLAEKARLANEQSQIDRRNAIDALKEADSQREVASEQREVAQHNLYYAQMHLAQQGWRQPVGLPHMRELLAKWLPKGESPDRRGWEWFYLNSLPYENLRTLTESGRSTRPCTVAWHTASKRLAAGTPDGLIRIWDVDREQTTLTLNGPGPAGDWWGASWFAWSPDGGKLAAGFRDATVHVWETRSGRELGIFRGHKSPIKAIAYSSDGLRLAAWGWDGTIKIWDAATGHLNEDVAHPGKLCVGAWSPNDKHLASGHDDGTVTISGTHAGDKVVTLRGHVNLILALAWSPDGARLASASGDYTARVWDIASGKTALGPLPHSHEVHSVTWEPNGQRLAAGSADQTVKIWNATTGHEELTLRGHAQSVTSLAWHPDGRLASGCDDSSVRIWNSVRDQEASVLPGHVGKATSVSWSPDGKRLASGGDDGKIRIWDPATRAEVISINAHDQGRLWPQYGLIRSVAWSPDGQQVASAGLDGTAKVWEVAGGREVFALPADHGPVWSVAWSRNGTHLAASSGDGTIRVVEGLKHTPKVHRFQVHQDGWRGADQHHGRLRGLAWSPREDRLASVGADGLVTLWDPIRGTELAALRGHLQPWISSVAWSPDGKRLASAGEDRLVIVWDAETGRKLSTMHDHNTWVEAVVWSPDGTRLASAGIDNTVRVSDPLTGEEALVLRGTAGMFHDVSWHPDGTQLAAASSDGHVWLWNASCGFERDTTPRGLPFIDRKIASGTARGEDVRWAAESYVVAGRTEQALALFGKCVQANPTDMSLSLRLATLQAWFGKETDFTATCHLLMEQAERTSTPTAASRAAQVYCLRPSTDAHLMAQALKLAWHAVELGKSDLLRPWFQMSLGMAEYRNSQYAAADATLATAEQTTRSPLVENTSRLYRLMSLFKQGRQDDARKQLGEVEARMPPLPADETKPRLDGRAASADELILWLAYREARALLQPPSSTTPPAPR